MNTTKPKPRNKRPLARRAHILVATASLLLAPCLRAQTPAPAAKEAAVPAASAQGNGAHPATESGARLYTVKFDGGRIPGLCDTLRKAFPGDNVVVSDSLENTRLTAFELRNVRLAEIGRTVEFLGEGRLSVEVVENAGAGNIWRIGRKNAAEAAASVKIRSVAAPHLFADEKKVEAILESAREMVMRRLDANGVIGGARGEFRGVDVRPLKSQGIFVIIGDEDGVAGLENLLKAAEQRLAESTAAKVAAVAANGPKMRAILAPHLFAEEKRLASVMKTLRAMQDTLAKVDDEIRNETGSDTARIAWASADPRNEQKVFLLLGSEAGIAGMESLIKAAEQLAAEEDAKIDAEMKAVRAEKLKQADLQADKDRAKAEKREQ